MIARRHLLLGAGGLGLGVVAGAVEPIVYAIAVRRYEFEPRIVRVRAAVPIILEFTSSDRLHGVAISALGVRVDVPVGEPVRVRLAGLAAGDYAMVCDVFCGADHEEMHGEIIGET